MRKSIIYNADTSNRFQLLNQSIGWFVIFQMNEINLTRVEIKMIIILAALFIYT